MQQDPWLYFTYTALGAAIGVVAGVFIQFFLETLINRNRNKRYLSNAHAEAQYNISLINEMIGELSNLKAASQPDAIARYFGYFSNGGAFWIALNKLITDANGYSIFSTSELHSIQKAQRFLSAGTEGWIHARIQEIKKGSDVNSMLDLARHLENECRKTLTTLEMVAGKNK